MKKGIVVTVLSDEPIKFLGANNRAFVAEPGKDVVVLNRQYALSLAVSGFAEITVDQSLVKPPTAIVKKVKEVEEEIVVVISLLSDFLDEGEIALLAKGGYFTVVQVKEASSKELLEISGLGKATLATIRGKLSASA